MSEKTQKPAGTNQLLVDLGPIAVFVVTFNLAERFAPENAVYIATGVFIAATLAACAYCQWKRGRIPPVLLVTGVLVTAFGGLTLFLRDETFIKIKPTFVYGFYAVAIAFSVLIKQNIWKLLFGHVFTLPDRIWTVLALRWAAWFAMLAVLNEFVRNTFSTHDFIQARLLIFMPLVFLFALANAPLVLKHSPPDDASGGKPEGGAVT